MPLTSEQVLELISAGESQVVEFLSEMPPGDVISIILTAFANTEGGTLLIGVGDGGEVIGLPMAQLIMAEARLNRIASSLFSWPFEIGSVDLTGKNVAYISVNPAPKHLAPVTTSTGEVYSRRGATIYKATPGELSAQGESRRAIINGRKTKLRETGKPIADMPDRTKGGASEPSKVREFIAFVAMSFRHEEEPALVDYYRAMERATGKAKHPVTLTRIDLVEGDYEISQKLMDDIDKADIVIADFTLRPSNVYFELGYARGRRKRIIQTARKDTPLEFDIRNWRTVFYRNATELEEKLVQALDMACSELAGDEK